MGGLDWLVLIAEIIVGICLCFAGYKFRKYLMSVVWFIVGYLFVKQFGPLIISDYKILFLSEILVGLIFAVFSFDLTIISEYLIGFYAGFSLVTSFTGLTLVGIIIGIIVGIILALVASRYSKYIIMIATSYLGAHLIAEHIPVLFTSLKISTAVIAIVLFVVGLLVQLLTNMKRENYEDE